MKHFTLGIILAIAAMAQQERPAGLTVHTWVREDIFAGWMVNDMARHMNGVAKLNKILEAKPDDAVALSWLGGSYLYRAAVAHEAGKSADFDRYYAEAIKAIDRANELAPRDAGVLSVTGGSFGLFADRLPADKKADGWKRSRTAYAALHKEQQQFADQLPLHMKGELLAGNAMAAQRVGDTEESQKYLTKIVKDLAGSPYAARAQRWMDQPEVASKSSLLCQTCHEPGRLEARLAAMKKQQ
ncbi:MAG: hypothetical protein FJW20_16900 [Acidimicrobiia bacterium]|nr:hypothetical protein [Acidimicrobiia bacterium]